MIGFLFIALHAYMMYARTKGIIRETQDIVVRVNSLEELLRIDKELDGSVIDG